eukprot:m.16684 g.16684  ORF g.16684 m.16684 type:complete len:229 (-) comp11159_c0_seq1:83-769(-)
MGSGITKAMIADAEKEVVEAEEKLETSKKELEESKEKKEKQAKEVEELKKKQEEVAAEKAEEIQTKVTQLEEQKAEMDREIAEVEALIATNAELERQATQAMNEAQDSHDVAGARLAKATSIHNASQERRRILIERREFLKDQVIDYHSKAENFKEMALSGVVNTPQGTSWACGPWMYSGANGEIMGPTEAMPSSDMTRPTEKHGLRMVQETADDTPPWIIKGQAIAT